MKVLVINTYGGSLILGAKQLELEIIGSYEDVGFGLPIQQANFPELNFIPMRHQWPAQDLSETFVIAHPPCSAFSVQNSNPAKRGTDSAAFACTKSVLDYALVQCRAVGLAIESVVGAMQGAWGIHQKFADENGYNLYRVLQNGSMFGAQWRDRFWVVYIRKGAAPDVMGWTLMPRWSTVRETVDSYMEGPAPAGLDAELAKLRQRFIDEAGCTAEDLEFIFEHNPDELTSVDDLLWRRKFPTEVRWEVCKRYVTKYASSAMVMLAPRGLCPVLLGSSWWFMDGCNMTERGYKRLMGFPSEYIFPEGTTRKDNYRADMRTYLSKGVMPPVASFILENALSHIGALKSSLQRHVGFDGAYKLDIAPNFIADFRIRKKTWGQAEPPLRHEDEHGIAHQVAQSVFVPKPYVEIAVDTQTMSDPVPKHIKVKVPRQPREHTPRAPKSPWNSPQIEESLRETLFIRPNTADAYALHESHGYHRMGVRPGDVLLDLGAHIGCVASRAALIGAAKVISVEAESENFELLQQNTRSFSNVEILNGAVYGGMDHFVNLHRVSRRNDGGHSTGTHSVLFTTRGDTVQVPRLDFHELVAEYKPTVIKCDVEGSEFSWSWENLPDHVRSIGIEFHTRRDLNRDKAKAIVATLEAQGFRPVNRLNMNSNFSAIIAYFTRERESEQVSEVQASPQQAMSV